MLISHLLIPASTFCSTVIQENGSQLHNAIELDSEPLVSQDTVEPVQAAASVQPGDPQQNELGLMEELEAAIKAMRELPPCLPSICFFTFLNTYQGSVVYIDV